MTTFGLFVLFFYASVLHVPPALVGLGAAIGLIWDAVIDPYIGYRSDVSRHPLGRRHAYMLAGVASMGLSFWLLLSPPDGLGVAALFGWLVATTLLFRTTSAIYRVPYLSLGAEMSDDPQGRTTIAAYRSAFGLIGTLGAATLSFVLFFPPAGDADPKLRADGYSSMGVMWGAVMTVTGLLGVIGTWGYRTGARDGAAVRRAGIPYRRAFVDALSQRSFRRLWIALVLFFMAVVLNAAVALHFYTWYVGISDSAALSRVQLFFYGGALAGVPAWALLARRYDKDVLMAAGLAMMAALLAAAPIVFGAGRLFAEASFAALCAGHALTGVFAAVAWVLPGAMLAECVDQDQVSSGVRREGIFFGLLNFGEKVAAGVAVLLAGAALQLYAKLAPGVAQAPETIARIGVVFAWLPALLLVIAAAAVSSYRLRPSSLDTTPARAEMRATRGLR
jgi:GPH family glycoside/pentoside/hexuronide:cation symporter